MWNSNLINVALKMGETMSPLTFWITLLMALIFFLLTAGFLWMYFIYKPKQPEYSAKGEGLSPLSFKGYWYKGRLNIILFSSILFLIFTISFLFFLI